MNSISVKICAVSLLWVLMLHGCSSNSITSTSSSEISSKTEEDYVIGASDSSYCFSMFSEMKNYPPFEGTGASKCPEYSSEKEMNEIWSKNVREQSLDIPSDDFRARDRWRPPFDNEVSIDAAYGKQVLSNERAWISSCRTSNAAPYILYLRYEPEPLFLRKVDDWNCYAAYNAEGGGRVYVFFVSSSHVFAQEGEEVVIDPQKEVYLYAMSLYVTDSLSYDDFASIKKGDSIQKVVDVDRSTEFEQKNWSVTDRMFSCHLLTDGLLTIKYEEVDNELVVQDVEYSSAYIFDTEFIYDLTDSDSREKMMIEGGIKRQLKILPQDYPPVE